MVDQRRRNMVKHFEGLLKNKDSKCEQKIKGMDRSIAIKMNQGKAEAPTEVLREVATMHPFDQDKHFTASTPINDL
jgi:hypothetical protein